MISGQLVCSRITLSCQDILVSTFTFVRKLLWLKLSIVSHRLLFYFVDLEVA